MQAKSLYNHIYKLLDSATPLDIDCGGLCDAACCKGDEDTGMYLFPFEEQMYSGNESWIKIYDSDFIVDGKAVKIAICRGKCDRTKRPLSCRIFPLFKYKDGKVRADLRAKHICPLAAANLKADEYNPRFIKNISRVFNILRKFKVTSTYLDKTEKLIIEQQEVADIFRH